MTNNSNKIRALVLAALMVFSVFAGTVAFAGTAAATNHSSSVLSATHYTDETGTPVVEIALNNSASSFSENFTVNLDNGTSVNVTSGEYTTTDGRVVLTVGNLYSNVDNVTVPSRIVTSGDDQNVDVTYAPVTVNATEGGAAVNESAYVGSNIAVVAGSPDTTIDFGGEYTPTRGTGTNSHVYVLDTDGLNTGTITVDTTDNNTNDANIELESLGLAVSADNATDETNVTGTVEAADINRDVDVALLNSDDEVVGSDTVSLGSSGNAEFDLGTVAAGSYTVVATDVNTGVEATTEVSVTEAAVGSASFAESAYTVPQGDIAQIEIDLEGGATEGTLVVGRESQSGYNANISFTDVNEDGTVVVQFNTYKAGNQSAEFVTAAGDDDTASAQAGNTSLESILEQGGYDLAVRSGNTSYNATQVFESSESSFSALSISERSTDGMMLWTAPAGAPSSGNTILDKTLTQDTTIAQNDWVVHQISATGLEGIVGDEFTADDLGDGLNVSVKQTDESTLSNRKPKTLNVSDGSGITLISDADNSTYYIAVNTAAANFDRGTSETGLSAQAGEDYVATFTVDDERLLGEDADAQSVNATFEIVERTGTIDETPVTVNAAENQTVTGTSSVAPGTEFTVTMSSTGDTSPGFYKNPTATVNEDGTWSVTADFADQTVGDTFSVKANDNFVTAIDADGEVVAEETATPTATAEPTATATAEPTATATAEPTATATAEPTATDAPATDEPTATDEPDTTTSTTPGFGVAVALVALLAAALLAGRRE